MRHFSLNGLSATPRQRLENTAVANARRTAARNDSHKFAAHGPQALQFGIDARDLMASDRVNTLAGRVGAIGEF
jgi:hypothetical protein